MKAWIVYIPTVETFSSNIYLVYLIDIAVVIMMRLSRELGCYRFGILSVFAKFPVFLVNSMLPKAGGRDD